jgi:hypothetical protein
LREKADHAVPQPGALLDNAFPRGNATILGATEIVRFVIELAWDVSGLDMCEMLTRDHQERRRETSERLEHWIVSLRHDLHPRKSIHVIQQEIDDIASGEQRELLDELDDEPKIDYCRKEFRRVNVETITRCIQGLLSVLVNMFHREAENDQVSAGDTPLQLKVRQPPAYGSLHSWRPRGYCGWLLEG